MNRLYRCALQPSLCHQWQRVTSSAQASSSRSFISVPAYQEKEAKQSKQRKREKSSERSSSSFFLIDEELRAKQIAKSPAARRREITKERQSGRIESERERNERRKWELRKVKAEALMSYRRSAQSKQGVTAAIAEASSSSRDALEGVGKTKLGDSDRPSKYAEPSSTGYEKKGDDTWMVKGHNDKSKIPGYKLPFRIKTSPRVGTPKRGPISRFTPGATSKEREEIIYAQGAEREEHLEEKEMLEEEEVLELERKWLEGTQLIKEEMEKRKELVKQEMRMDALMEQESKSTGHNLETPSGISIGGMRIGAKEKEQSAVTRRLLEMLPPVEMDRLSEKRVRERSDDAMPPQNDEIKREEKGKSGAGILLAGSTVNPRPPMTYNLHEPHSPYYSSSYDGDYSLRSTDDLALLDEVPLDAPPSMYATMKPFLHNAKRSYVSVVVDADQLVFLPELLNMGEQGAELACKHIHQSIQQDFGEKIDRRQIRLLMFCNRIGLIAYLASRGTVDRTQFNRFTDAIMRFSPLSLYAHCGRGNQAADYKVKATIVDHVFDPDCQMTYIGGLGDHGYILEIEELRKGGHLPKLRFFNLPESYQRSRYLAEYKSRGVSWGNSIFTTTTELIRLEDRAAEIEKRQKEEEKEKEAEADAKKNANAKKNAKKKESHQGQLDELSTQRMKVSRNVLNTSTSYIQM